MKRSFALLLLLACLVFVASAQKIVDPEKPSDAYKGFVTINEIHTGFGLGETLVPYSGSFFGVTTVNGYQFNKSLFLGGGTGISFYNGGVLVPLYVDFRAELELYPMNLIAVVDGGSLLNFLDFSGTKFFINPGAGIVFPLNNKLSINLIGGILFQYRDHRDTFIDIKAGVTYKFSEK